MIRVTVLYPKTSDSTFDMDYYLNTHTPMVKERLMPLGMLHIEVDQGLAGMAPGQPPTYAIMAYLVFGSGAEITGDIVNFTNVQPHIQINQIIVS
jgi:uncharacterized protein (TIGR02118 family)